MVCLGEVHIGYLGLHMGQSGFIWATPVFIWASQGFILVTGWATWSSYRPLSEGLFSHSNGPLGVSYGPLEGS